MKIRIGIAALALAVASTAVVAVPVPKDDVAVVAHTSLNGIAPTSHSGIHPEWFYDLNVTVGATISDQICVDLTMTDEDAVADSFVFGFNVVGDTGILAASPNPVTLTLSDAGDKAAGPTRQVCFGLSGSATAAGDYAINIQINVEPANDANQVALSHDTIHIHVHAAAAAAMSCFVSDSDFNFLLDCANAEVTSGSNGRFTIQVNKGKSPVEVSTQPGQFYYNALWQNTSGADRVVRVVFELHGVHAHGAQAIHASVFPPFPALSDFNFDTVNNDIPSGADGVLDNVTVPAGTVLWTDYHVEWDGIGWAPPANLATSCGGANQVWSMSATVYDTHGTTDTTDDTVLAGPCTAGAAGYKK